MRGLRSSIVQNQSGMISFLVVMIMMVVITLIVLGFSQVTRSNQREALDRELSAQAYYAAESGVNATESAIQTDLQHGTPLNPKTSCANDYDGNPLPLLNTSGTIKYTCVLVNPTPQSLTQTNVAQGDSVVFPIHTTSTLSSLSFSWSASDSSQTGCITTPSSCASQSESYYPTAASWQYPFALLRVDLLQVPTTVDGLSLEQATDTLYLSPYGHYNGDVYDSAGNDLSASAGFSLPFGGTGTAFYGAGCEEGGTSGDCVTSGNPHCTTGECVVKVALPTIPVGTNYVYYVRITPLYQDASSITVSGELPGSPPTQATFQDAQAVIDVTGQDQDELQRVQAHMDIAGTTNDIPSYALSSTGDVCKTFSIAPGDSVPNSLSTLCSP